jgi:hypothetical protein
MAHYLVTYDLHNERNYPPVWAALERLGAVKALESVWLLTSTSGAGDLREALKAAADGDDSILVIELKAGSNWSGARILPAGLDWLERNIHRYRQ